MFYRLYFFMLRFHRHYVVLLSLKLRYNLQSAAT